MNQIENKTYTVLVSYFGRPRPSSVNTSPTETTCVHGLIHFNDVTVNHVAGNHKILPAYLKKITILEYNYGSAGRSLCSCNSKSFGFVLLQVKASERAQDSSPTVHSGHYGGAGGHQRHDGGVEAVWPLVSADLARCVTV